MFHHTFKINVKKSAPTKKHRIAIWETMFGEVSAMNDSGDVKHFKYDYDGALVFAGIANGPAGPNRDPRWARNKKKIFGQICPIVRSCDFKNGNLGPSPSQFCMWIRKDES